VCTVPWILYNARHPIIAVETPLPRHLAHLGYSPGMNTSVLQTPRSSLYFHAHHELESGFRNLADLLKERGCYRIGLVKGWDDWEYPLWPLLQAGTNEQVRIEHVEVSNRSGELARPQAGLSPCAYVKIDRLDMKVRLMPPR